MSQSLDTPKTSPIQLVANTFCARRTLRPLDLNINARIARLEDLVKTHTDTFKRCPKGYVLNTKYPGLTINIGNGLQREVKWVKQLEQGTVACFTEDDSPGDTPHIVKIYAQPCATAEPIEPLPIWLESILLGPSAAFNTLAEAARELDD